ncbi:MAG: OmpH family outer membrane protein [Bacteroidetes bacterium]|nr:MAG: OmpH family outer membrane protein [Bacteroidota bacterium]
MNFKRVLSFAVAFVGVVSLGLAQDKLAYFDENYAMPLLPEYKTVQAEMEAFNKQIKAEIEKLEKEYKDKLTALQAMAAKPDASQVLLESGQKELEAIDKRIQNMEENAQKEGSDKLMKKLEPINAKVTKALEEVAKDNGNIYIFRREAAVFVLEENNVSDLVLKKLGVTPTTTVANRGNLKSTNKVGYFDQNYVIPLLPEFKKVQKDVETFREFLKAEMQKEQEKGQKLMAETEQLAKTLPPAQLQMRQEELQKIDAKLQEMQQTASNKVQEKYTKAMEPIIKNVQTKVDEIAKEKGYTYIFRLESSLHEPKDANISDAVLQKFGVTPPAPTEKKEN